MKVERQQVLTKRLRPSAGIHYVCAYEEKSTLLEKANARRLQRTLPGCFPSRTLSVEGKPVVIVGGPPKLASGAGKGRSQPALCIGSGDWDMSQSVREKHQLYERGDASRVLDQRRRKSDYPINPDSEQRRVGISNESGVNSRRQPRAQMPVAQGLTAQVHISVIYTHHQNTYCTLSPNMRIIGQFSTECSNKYVF